MCAALALFMCVSVSMCYVCVCVCGGGGMCVALALFICVCVSKYSLTQCHSQSPPHACLENPAETDRARKLPGCVILLSVLSFPECILP